MSAAQYVRASAYCKKPPAVFCRFSWIQKPAAGACLKHALAEGLRLCNWPVQSQLIIPPMVPLPAHMAKIRISSLGLVPICFLIRNEVPSRMRK